jgi:hypothetical protein
MQVEVGSLWVAQRTYEWTWIQEGVVAKVCEPIVTGTVGFVSAYEMGSFYCLSTEGFLESFSPVQPISDEEIIG